MEPLTETSYEATKPARRYVTTACNPCRESKTKCDATRPHCAQCRKRNKPCVYMEKGDKRKVSLRATVELLSARVNELTQIITHHGIQVPPMSLEERISLENVLRTLELPLPENFTTNAASSSTAPEFSQSITEKDRNADNGALRGGSNLSQDAPMLQSVGTEAQAQLSEVDIAAFVDGLQDFSDGLGTESPEWPWFASDTATATNLATIGSLDSFDPQQLVAESSANIPFANNTFPSGTEARPETSEGEDEADTDLVAQLATRSGSLHLAPDGQLRFFGAAANIHLLDERMQFQNSTDVRSVHDEGQRLLEHAGVHQEIDPSFRQHLLELYFQWHERCLPLVDRVSFEAALQRFDHDGDHTGYCSGVLVNAMCAIGATFEAKYHPNFITFPKPLSEFFAERAKVSLDIELDSPCVATMQGLILLSNHEASMDRDARGWLYSGMAMRSTFDLGLHIDCSPYVQRGKMSGREADARRTAFWGCFVVNHLYSFYTGRPFEVDVKEITVARPNGYASTSIGTPENVAWLSNTDTDHPMSIAAQLVRLCVIVAPQAHMLYMYAQSDVNVDELWNLSQETTSQSFTWKATLIGDLQVDFRDPDKRYSPPVSMSHMLYYYSQIMLHRPYTSKVRQPNPSQGPGCTYARTVCIESGTAISKSLAIYEAQHTFQRANVHVVHAIFSAALIMIYAMSSGAGVEEPTQGAVGWHEGKSTAAANLSICFRALDETSRAFERAKHVRESLLAIQSRWNRTRRKHNTSKRLLRQPSNEPRKRRPTIVERPEPSRSDYMASFE